MLNDPLIDIITRFRPFTSLRQRAMEGVFITETTISDILSDPSRTAFRLRMEPGIGLKSRYQIIAAVHDALEFELGDDWPANIRENISARLPTGILDHGRLQEFLEQWPHPDSGPAVSQGALVKMKRQSS